MGRYREYKIIEVAEGALGTLFLGASKVPIDLLEKKLNHYAKDNWQVVFQIIEKKRFLGFWSRESVIVTLGRE